MYSIFLFLFFAEIDYNFDSDVNKAPKIPTTNSVIPVTDAPLKSIQIAPDNATNK